MLKHLYGYHIHRRAPIHSTRIATPIVFILGTTLWMSDFTRLVVLEGKIWKCWIISGTHRKVLIRLAKLIVDIRVL